MQRLERSPAIAAALFGITAEILFLIRLSVPHKLVFDEVHYVPAARTLRALSAPANIEHPLLGKELIAVGMMLFGDTPFGWRFMSTLAATAVVVGVFAIVHLLTGRVRAATFAAAVALLNFTIYVQARIAMLDGFMAAFVVASVALLLWAMRRGGWGRWTAGAALLGLAVACKWSAAPLVAFAAAGFVWAKRDDPARWPGLAILPAVAVLGVVSVAAYFLSFIPAFFYANEPMTLARLLPFQLEMYRRQTQVLPPHTYQSNWWTWPLQVRPIWYLYEPADGAQRGILMIGNPAVMWGGLIAVAACLVGWVKSGSARLLGAALLWFGSYVIWAVIPKSLGFFYYYYLPSIFLAVALAAAFDHWRHRLAGWDAAYLAVCAALAVYFFPILSAQALPNGGAFHRWTWFSTWV